MSNQDTRTERWEQIQRRKKINRKDSYKVKGRYARKREYPPIETLEEKVEEALNNMKL